MNRVKRVFCLFLFILSLIYSKSFFNNVEYEDFVFDNDSFSWIESLTDTNFKSSTSFLDLKDKDVSFMKNSFLSGSLKSDKVNNNVPIVYIFNTHQTEEYAKNVYNITPTVVTASSILADELNNFGISSFVETKDVIKEVKKRGYDYTGTYTVSFEYLKSRKKEFPSLEYYFDVHRDSITGSSARVKIGDKSYASIMFLVGANYEGYEKHIDNINIMKSYLDKNYPGLVRNTYIQKKSSFNQEYSQKMFLIEIGGPDNTLEEVYNSTKALAESIKYYMEEEK